MAEACHCAPGHCAEAANAARLAADPKPGPPQPPPLNPRPLIPTADGGWREPPVCRRETYRTLRAVLLADAAPWWRPFARRRERRALHTLDRMIGRRERLPHVRGEN